MILDANILIALLDDQDPHHEAATDLVVNAESPYGAHEVTWAEALVLPAKTGRMDEAIDELANGLGILHVTSDEGFSVALARVRAETGVKMPDAIVLASAEQESMPLATFDDRLARAARARGVEVLPHTEGV